jgi:hypothetical protein
MLSGLNYSKLTRSVVLRAASSIVRISLVKKVQIAGFQTSKATCDSLKSPEEIIEECTRLRESMQALNDVNCLFIYFSILLAKLITFHA